MKIAIHFKPEVYYHTNKWNGEWLSYCRQNGIEHEIVDLFAPGALEELRRFDAVLWHLSNYSLQEMLFARSLLRAAKQMGLAVFPDDATSWHFDDKVAQMFLLQSVDAPIPTSWFFATRAEALEWIRSECQFPVVAKLKSGSGASNVKLLEDSSEASKYVRRLFLFGYSPSPNVVFKTVSNVQSARSMKTVVARARRAPEFFRTKRRARQFPREKGYAYFQDFVPNEGFDLKVTVMGDKLGFFARHSRRGDFRASGGGNPYYDRSLVSSNIIESAFRTSDELGFQCMGYDYVVDERDGQGRIVEMSYGFSHTMLLASEGYWDRAGQWHDEPLNAPQEVIRNLIASRSALDDPGSITGNPPGVSG